MSDRTIQSRIVGAMLGLACGDALGAPAEFNNQQYIRDQWGTLTEMVGGRQWDLGEWTDDTGMALCIAEGILAQPEDPVRETGGRFLQWQKTAKDIGATIRAALRAYEGDWADAALSTPQARSGRAGGNGSLMRTLPVALAYSEDRATMVKVAARLSAMTHWDRQAETCCIIYCLWGANVLEGQPLHDGWYAALRQAREEAFAPQHTQETPGGVKLTQTEFWERLEGIEKLTYDQLQPSGYAGYVVECLEAAVWCCLHADSLEDALVKAVNLAGESDTIGAVAGGIAGAYWGTEAIPQRWLAKLHQREYLETVAIKLIHLRRHLQVYATNGLPQFNWNWVTDRIMAGRNPLTCHDIQTLSDLGITHILDLREPHEWAAPMLGNEAIEEIERRRLERLNLVVEDMGEPSSEDLARVCEYLEETLQNDNNYVYVHCRAGMERTAAVLIAYHAHSKGISYEKAYAQLKKRRPIFKPLPNQERAVRQWLNNR